MSRARVVHAELLAHRFRFATAPGLFSADRIDEGTRLLLDHLPEGTPGSVLDLGCGYGALGLPIAAQHPAAEVVLADRNAVAVAFARRNAEAHGLKRVSVLASLGYRDLAPERRFDWILCNVPARIGDRALAHFLGEGARRLKPGGALRVVVIQDLGETVEHLAAEHGWPVRRCADGARHRVYALPPLPAGDAPTRGPADDDESIYERDTVQLGALTLTRPQDISEDPAHLKEGLPLLTELLPRQPGARGLVWRGGYGAVALVLASRGAEVIAADLDLLATTFTHRNAAAAGLTVSTRGAPSLAEAVNDGERFTSLVGELSTSATAKDVRDEIAASQNVLAPGGHALWLGLTRQARGLMDQGTPLASRGPFTVWRLAAGASGGTGKRGARG